MKKNILLILTVFAIFNTGCQQKNSTEQTRANAVVRGGYAQTYKRESPYNNSNLIETSEAEPPSRTKARAENLSYAIVRLEGIQAVSVVLNHKTAIIGIEVNPELDSAKLIKLKKDVEREVKMCDHGVDHVSVTADPALVERVNNVADFIITVCVTEQ